MTLTEILYLSLQVAFTILLAFHAIVPELKVKRLSQGEQRQKRDKIVSFLKRPPFRAISLIIFIIGLVFSTTMKEVSSSAVNDKKLETKDSIRQEKADQYSTAIKAALKSQGFSLKLVNDKLIVLKDSLKLKKITITNNKTIPPLLWFSISVDSVGYGIKNIIISMYTSGSNCTNVRLYTSYAGLEERHLFLIQRNLGHFDTNSSCL